MKNQKTNWISRYLTAITLYLAVVIGNYFLVASLLPTLTLSIDILFFSFEGLLYFGTYYVLCRIMKKKPTLIPSITSAIIGILFLVLVSSLAHASNPTIVLAFAVALTTAFASTFAVMLAICIALAVWESDADDSYDCYDKVKP